MNIVLALLDARPVAASSVGFVAVAGLLAAVFPLRGGSGQHAHAGPGALTVPQLRDRMETAARPRIPGPEQLARLAAHAECLPKRMRQKLDLPPGYVGRHRLIEWPPEYKVEFHPPRAEISFAWSAAH
ncbi:hypothetical protein GCM10009854_08050 [Saccharopolyspora halophila]|uniref:Uncharacterized protein n=1 Tax=Saccharopolyspora halophila TaxID=405551 RepID=A0ABN3FP52_9PSEU